MTATQRRRELLDEALAGADEANRAALVAEIVRLAAAAPRDVTDRAYHLALLARLASLRPPAGATQLLDGLTSDLPLVVLGRAPALTVAGADALVDIVSARRAAGGRVGLADLPALQAATGGDGAFDEMAGAVHARWLAEADRPYLERDVAVLLPVRLETLFRSDDAGWQLWLRIVPDEASIRRDDPTPKLVEVAQLEAMWTAIAADVTDAERARPVDEWLDTLTGRTEWATLCGRVGAGRAAWLVAACPPLVDGATVTVNASGAADGPASPNRVGGFPPRLEVWLAFGDEEPTFAAATDVRLDALAFDLIGARPAGPNSTDLVHERDRWWVSWPQAKEVGLGVELPLPAGRTPADLRVLYVVGVGDEHPEAHFRAQIEAGELAVLPRGAPTNTVDGAPAADLGQDLDTWRVTAQRRLRHLGAAGPDESALTRSLAGFGADLPAAPLAHTIDDLDGALVRTLWPALWGHQLRDVWGCVEEADWLGGWAARHLRPEGPLPPVRIDTQPYGLLPAAALRRWQVAEDEGPLAPLEDRLRHGLLPMRAHWAATAEGTGTSVGASTERLLDLIARDAPSAGYAHRPALAVELWAGLYSSLGGFDPARYDDWVRDTFQPVYDLLRRGPEEPPGMRQLVTGGGPEPLAIPLVVPTGWPWWFYEVGPDGHLRRDEHGNPVPAMTVEQGFVRLLETLRDVGHRHDLTLERWRGVLPDSLLVRLALHAGVLSGAAVVQTNAGGPAPIREPLVGDTALPTVITDLSQQYNPVGSHDHPAGAVRVTVVEGLEQLLKSLAEQPADGGAMAQLERAFRATVDTATHRIDPWLVGMAARRLEHLRDHPESRFRLGVYGWVDGPILGAPGPTEGGLLHAPSHAQALTAAILRDKSITERVGTGSADLWSLQLESRRVRLAEELAEEVQLGSHIFEALGRRVEQIVGVRTPVGPVVEATARVDALRTHYPMRKGRFDRGRVCHGADALTGLLGPTPAVEVTAEQRAELELLATVLDAYGDLLVAEAVHQVVSGQADRAGAAMDAAAGLAKPPTLAFSETPLAGAALTTAAVGVVRHRPAIADPDPTTPPARLADASVADALSDLVGTAAIWTWRTPDGAEITLAGLGLEPADTLAVSGDLLDNLARAALGADPHTSLAGSGRRRHGLARDVVRALGSQPAFLRDVAPPTMTPAEADEVRAADQAILAELRARYATLRASAQLMVDELASAQATADPAALRQALFRALRWGVTPAADADDPRALYQLLVTGSAAQAVTLAERAEEALRTRLAAAPPVSGTEPLGRAIAELAAPDGLLAILSGIDASTLARVGRLRTDAPDAGLDAEWLTVVAAVRPRLAAVEALQLEAATVASDFPGFTGWTGSPGDPWQTGALAAHQASRRGPDGGQGTLPRFVAAYTSRAVSWDAGATVAVGLIDAWSDAVPYADQVSTAVFGFNAPAARAPQAILLAVPADLASGYGARLDVPELVEVLAETRELAHARAVDAEALGGYLAAVPTTAFPVTGVSGVHLETGTSFPY